MEKYQVIFVKYYGEEDPYSKFFSSEWEAEDWVNDLKSYSDDYDEVDFFNPETNQRYPGYKIEKINPQMTNEQLRMQMLAGVITESQYKSRLEEVKDISKKTF
jgi:hypothetical protein